ncbi:MAG: hypothetical protein GEU83_12185 [Pseudonocardiaceae bacterium]|nr:hypothetical protein [Pseudonocardiaceae bacterium]
MLPLTMTDEERPHIDAIGRSMEAGFRFLHLRSDDGLVVAAIYAERWRDGALDTYTALGMTEAMAARYPAPGGPADVDPHPLWHASGSVQEVVTDLLALPRHGERGAPRKRLQAPSNLWLPPSARP